MTDLTPARSALKDRLAQRQIVMGADEIERTPEVENNLNLLASRVLNTPSGKEFMIYLQSITVQRILPPTESDAALRHREGARWLFAVMKRRSILGADAEAIGGGA